VVRSISVKIVHSASIVIPLKTANAVTNVLPATIAWVAKNAAAAGIVIHVPIAGTAATVYPVSTA
jgi:hypothetical protein